MKLSYNELKEMLEMVSSNIMNESKKYGDVKIYKESENYKVKSSVYEKLATEFYGRELKINENSIFGLLDLE